MTKAKEKNPASIIDVLFYKTATDKDFHPVPLCEFVEGEITLNDDGAVVVDNGNVELFTPFRFVSLVRQFLPSFDGPVTEAYLRVKDEEGVKLDLS